MVFQQMRVRNTNAFSVAELEDSRLSTVDLQFLKSAVFEKRLVKSRNLTNSKAYCSKYSRKLVSVEVFTKSR